MKPWIHTRFMLENLSVPPAEVPVRPVASLIPNARVWLLMDQLQPIQTLVFWTTDQLTGKYQFLLDLVLLQPLNTAEVIIDHQLFWSEFYLEFLRNFADPRNSLWILLTRWCEICKYPYNKSWFMNKFLWFHSAQWN